MSMRACRIMPVLLLPCGLALPPAAATTIAVAEAPLRCVAVGALGFDDVPDPANRCEVVAFGRVRGTVPPLSYQLQAWPAGGQAPPSQRGAAGLQVGGPPSNGTGVALLTPTAGKGLLRLVAGGAGRSAVIAEPRLVRTTQGPLVVIQAGATMSMHPNFDQALRLIGGRWTKVTDGWSGHIRIPKGVAQWHDSAIDWRRLRAFGGLWKPDDAACCPTGGSYIAHLRLDGRRLVLGSIQYYRGSLPFP